jgi:hypothetical protein
MKLQMAGGVGFEPTVPFFYGPFYGRAKFCCKTAQFYATLCKHGIAELPSVRNAVRRCENKRKKPSSNYESPALTAELQARVDYAVSIAHRE